MDEFYLAGAFGNFISKESAQKIGLISNEIPLNKIIPLGNAALFGAKLFLQYESARKYAEKIIPAKICFFELAGNPDFQDRFTDNLFLG